MVEMAGIPPAALAAYLAGLGANVSLARWLPPRSRGSLGVRKHFPMYFSERSC